MTAQATWHHWRTMRAEADAKWLAATPAMQKQIAAALTSSAANEGVQHATQNRS